jgi:putative Holliday junction resolvase
MPGTRERPGRADRNPDVVVAFDFGLRRIGVATGNLVTRIASELKTLETGPEPPWSELDAVVAGFGPGTLVVGLPPSSSAPTSITERARLFAASLAARYALPVETVDESLTSVQAEAELRDARRDGRRRRRIDKGDIDRRAARLIVEQWMSAQAPRRSLP